MGFFRNCFGFLTTQLNQNFFEKLQQVIRKKDIIPKTVYER